MTKEYNQLQNLTQKVHSKIIDTSFYKVKKNLLVFETWSNQFMAQYKPKETELKSVYNKNIFNTKPEYKLKTLTIKNKKRAQSIIRQLKTKKTKNERIRLFNIFVTKDSIDKSTKDKKGDLGWINQSKLLPNIKNSILQLNVNDIMTLKIKDNIQILYLEDISKPRKTTFSETKPLLIKMAKKEALNNEIKELVK